MMIQTSVQTQKQAMKSDSGAAVGGALGTSHGLTSAGMKGPRGIPTCGLSADSLFSRL